MNDPRAADLTVSGPEGALFSFCEKTYRLTLLEAPKKVLVDRLLARAIKDNRDDDTAEVINVRLQEYEKKTIPVAHYYDKKGIYYPIDGLGLIDDVSNRVINGVEESIKKTLLNVIVYGYPGAGKGTQCKNLAERYGLVYISIGRILREEFEAKQKLENEDFEKRLFDTKEVSEQQRKELEEKLEQERKELDQKQSDLEAEMACKIAESEAKMAQTLKEREASMTALQKEKDKMEEKLNSERETFREQLSKLEENNQESESSHLQKLEHLKDDFGQRLLKSQTGLQSLMSMKKSDIASKKDDNEPKKVCTLVEFQVAC